MSSFMGEKVFKIYTIVIVNIEDDGGIKKENVTFEAINYDGHGFRYYNFYRNTLLTLN